MIHIAICDDEREFVEHLRGLLERYADETEEEIKITACYDGMELVEKYDPGIDLIFLDIQMKLVDGLHAAGQIRRMDEKVGIIFLTTLAQYGLEGYKYQAEDYIIKPLKYVRLKAELDGWLKKHRKDESACIVVSNDTGKYKIPLKSLRYVEIFNRNLLLHTEQENIVCYKKMRELEQELGGQGFARCHVSYLVNLYYVKSVNARELEVKLLTGEALPVSQPKRKEFMERLADYWGDYL